MSGDFSVRCLTEDELSTLLDSAVYLLNISANVHITTIVWNALSDAIPTKPMEKTRYDFFLAPSEMEHVMRRLIKPAVYYKFNDFIKLYELRRSNMLIEAETQRLSVLRANRLSGSSR